MAKAGKRKEINYSPKQKTAVEATGKNVCVSSGAGSGKTSVLVGRFLHLVIREKVPPDAVVAITYTEKAANSMKERIVAAFLEKGLVEERRMLESACIGTIHSFASRLLRENPVEAGVDPHFTVIEEGQANLLMEEALEELLEGEAEDEEIFGLLEQYGEEPLKEGMKKIYSKVRSFGVSFDDLLAREICGEGEAWDGLERSLREFLGAKGQKESGTYLENRQAAGEILENLERLRTCASWEIVTELGRIRKQLKKKGALSDRIAEIQAFLESIIPMKIEKAGGRFKKSFASLYGKFVSRYEELKARSAFLDFDDLLAKAYALFASGDERCAAVRERYRKKTAFILVDEFQDTSRLQARWIDSIARPGGLFIIGDAKQSVYRFRNADLASFREKERAMKEDAGSLHIELGENYRSRTEILEFVNRFFRELWREDEFEFEPLTAKREFPVKKVPSVEFLCVEQAGEDENEDKMQARLREAKAAARRIKEIVESSEIQITERDGTSRRASYGDFAMLFRGMTNSNLYENELRELDIPYFVIRGRGFYEKQEVADLVDFLAILDDPKLDVELAAVLRSPLAGLSEDALFWLSRVKSGGPKEPDEDGEGDEEKREWKKGVPLCEGLSREDLIAKLPEEDRRKLARFLELYSQLRKKKDKLGISEILERCLTETSYDVKLLGTWMGKQKAVNVWKLAEIARQFEANQTFALRDFVAYIRDLKSQDPRESEAQVELERGDSVKLLTIHKAKGLEFPIVIVADLGRGKGGGEPEKFNFSERFGVGFKFKNSVTREWQEGSLFKENREWEKKKDSEEQKRLFYVAMTRSEEHLILTGVSGMGEIKEGKSYHEIPDWMQWLRKAFGYDGAGEKTRFDFSGIPVALLPAVGRTERPEARPALIRTAPFLKAFENLAAIGKREMGELAPFSPEKAEALAKTLAPFRKDYYETRDIPVTALLEFETCPGCYHDVYEMGITAKPGGADEDFSDEGERPLSGRSFGSVFHAIMEHFDFSRPVETEMRRVLADQKEILRPADIAALENAVRDFLKSELGRSLRKMELRREVPFIYRLPYGKLSGKIDLLAKTGAGDWLVLDYKTDKVREKKDLELKRDHYELQVLIYALAFREIAGIIPEHGILYFTALGEACTIPVTESGLKAVKDRISGALKRIASEKGRFGHRENCPFREMRYSTSEG